MLAVVLLLTAAFGAPKPLADTIPTDTFTREERSGDPIVWLDQPWRVTKFWRAVEITDNGFRSVTYCNDPNCRHCRHFVYGAR